MNREKVKNHYRDSKEEIESRLGEFRGLREASDERLFQELSFVIFSSQSSAKNSWNATQRLGEKGLLEKDRETIAQVLRQEEIQYEERKADYIISNREKLSQPTFNDPSTDLKLKQQIRPENLEKSRKWFAENIKGLSWKGASHFLRNTGYGKDFAILSSHTVSVLFDLEVIKASEPPKNAEEYLEMEEKVQEFSREIDIDIQALDLVLWSMRTGEVFK